MNYIIVFCEFIAILQKKQSITSLKIADLLMIKSRPQIFLKENEKKNYQ